jgi:Domain of unknown function (DUF4352)
MKCRRCLAPNPRDALSCWACGVRLQEFYAARRPRSFRPDAMRHYSAAPASVIRHQAWVDGLVLLSTVLFALLAAYFVLDVLPTGGSPATLLAALGRAPDAVTCLLTPPAVLPAQPAGTAQQARGVVTQVADVRLSATEGGREAGAGAQFLVVTAIIDNQGSQPIAYDLSDWTVVDGSGRAHDPEQLRGAGWLSAGRVDPGQRVQGALAFAVPQGEASHQVQFGPAGLRAVMRWDAAAPGGD